MLLTLQTNKDLYRGILLQRRYRFLIDVKLDDDLIVTAYCSNPGVMEGLIVPGAEVWLSKKLSKDQKVQWLWELVKVEGFLVSTNSSVANLVAAELFKSKRLPGFKQFTTLASEVRLGKNTRIDFVLHGRTCLHYVEVKTANLVYADGNAYFPDSNVKRSLKQLRELVRILRSGQKASILIVCLRKDAKRIRISDVHDEEFAEELRSATRLGLQLRGLLVEPKLSCYHIKGELEVDVRFYSTNQVKLWRSDNRKFSGWQKSHVQALPSILST